jgi:hypothetical protein
MNHDLPADINLWHIEHNPYGFASNENWLETAAKTEDILQLAHVYTDGPVIDVGFYADRFKVLIIT